VSVKFHGQSKVLVAVSSILAGTFEYEPRTFKCVFGFSRIDRVTR
jgi:hypothetical protein